MFEREPGDVGSEPRPQQPPLFDTAPDGTLAAPPELPELHPNASLTLARSWYGRDLERLRRPANTIASYLYDLTILEKLIGPKSIADISNRDIARYLGDATSKSTRKRRLTSVRGFFNYLRDVRVLDRDPSEGFQPHHIELKLPLPLFADEQERLLAAAEADEPWSATAIWLMMRLGLSRAELLDLRRDHIDRTEVSAPRVFIFAHDRTKPAKERVLVTEGRFSELYDRYLERGPVADVVFPVGPPAVNGMVERVRNAAGITKPVTPQTLRHTFAVDAARQGAEASQLLAMLGLADDPRNRQSVERYLKLARNVNQAPSAG